MTETGFGGGGYRYTLAAVPVAPLLENPTAQTVALAIGADSNPPHTEYALINETDGLYVGTDGSPSAAAAWLTGAAWGAVTVTGLSPTTDYTFRVKARNQEGLETDPGPGAECTTLSLATDTLFLSLGVLKVSSTISAPPFMRGVGTGVRIAGKNLDELGFMVDRIGGFESPRVVPDEELVPGAHIWRVWDEYFAPKRIVIEGHVHGSSPEDLRLRLAYLKSFLATFEGDPWRSSAPVRLERSDIPGRHWIAYYERLDRMEPLGRRSSATSAGIALTMKCPLPFAAANEVTRFTVTPTAGMFAAVDLGNAPSDAVYVITGPAENPSFSVGDMVFHSDFSDGLSFTDQENASGDGDFTPSENEPAAYRTTETGTGLLIAGTDTVSFTCTGNPSGGTWIAVISPLWQSPVQDGDVVIFEHRLDSDNYLRLFWDASQDAWVFRKRADGVDHEVSSGPQSFAAGTRIVLGVVYDSTNAGGMKLFVDGVQAGVAIDTSALDSSPDTLTLHAGDGTMQPEVVFDLVAGWSRMLSADEMLKIATDPQSVKNLNRMISFAGTLDEGDRLTLDSRLKTAELFDLSEGSRSNALGTVGGIIPALTPGRRRTASDRTQTVLYTKTQAAALEILFTRRYL